MLLYVSQHTGGLCACYCTEGEEGTYSRELPSGGALSTMVSVALTPASAPGIISFSLVSSCCDDVSDGRNNGSGAHCQVQEHHRVLFETTDGPRECVFTLPGSEDSTDTDKKGLMRSAVVQVLQRVCGGGPHSRHPQSMLSVAAVLSGDEEVGHSVEADVARSHSQSEYDQDAAVEALGMELTAAHLSYDAAQQRLQVLDCELLQLMALLAVLGDARDGLIMHAGTATETWDITGRADLLDWSPSLRNKSGSLSLKFRFRCEPIAGTGDLGPGNGVLLDIALTAHTLEAMRALQGCSLLMALHPTAAASCLHPSMDTCSAILELRPVVATAQNSEMSNREQQQQQHQYQFRHTFAVSSLSQMCAYRLTLSVAVDGPEAPTCATTQAALFTDAGALLGLVDLLIPLIYWLPVLQRSPDFAATEQLKKLMKDGNSDRGSGEVSSSSSGDPLVHELILNINGSAAAAAAIEKWISAVGVGGAADGAGAGAGSNGGNPLRAAFLPQQPEQPPVPRSLVTLIRQAANPSGEASRGKDKGKHKDKDKDTGGTPIVVTLRSSHREVLAAVSADVSAVLLPSNSEVDRVEELSVDVGMSATLDGSKYDHLPHNLQQV